MKTIYLQVKHPNSSGSVKILWRFQATDATFWSQMLEKELVYFYLFDFGCKLPLSTQFESKSLENCRLNKLIENYRFLKVLLRFQVREATFWSKQLICRYFCSIWPQNAVMHTPELKSLKTAFLLKENTFKLCFL